MERLKLKECLQACSDEIASSGKSRIPIDFQFDLFELYLRSNTNPKVYFRSRDGRREFLGLGLAQKLSSSDLEQPQNSPVFYGQMFDRQRERDRQWEGLDEDFIFKANICIEKTPTQTIIYFNSPEKQTNHLLEVIESISPQLPALESVPEITATQNIPEFNRWSDDIDQSLSGMESTSEELYDKVVLARRFTQYFGEQLDHENYIRHFVRPKGLHFIYLIKYAPDKSFISISPESLFRLERDCLMIDVIAGTKPITLSDTENLHMAKELQDDPKEIYEHEVVAQEVAKAMQHFCSGHSRVFERNVLKQKHVQHLYSLYEGALKKEVSLPQLIDFLHPTPAVGGRPQKVAMEVIRKTEPFNRGLYAAPCGVLSPQYSELLVAIRSAHLERDQVHIFAGAGIVKGSKGENEWKETDNKMRNFLTPLV